MNKIDIIYIRTSTDDQNPQTQLKDIMTVAPVGCKIYEEKQSAWKEDIKARPVFKEIYDLIMEDKVNSYNVWDLDRIYRKRTKVAEFMTLCKFKGTIVRSFRQKWLTEFENIPSPWNEIMRDLLIQIFGWMAEEESDKKSDRVKKSVRKENGITVSYKGNKWGRKEVKVNVYKLRALRHQGLSIREIAREVGVSKSKVASVLKNYPQKD